MRRIDLDLFFRLVLATVVVVLILPAVVDVDLWGHVMFGRDTVATRAIPTRDHYAFTSDLPWINHEWLTEVAMYAAYAAHPAFGLVGLRALLIAGLLWVVWADLRRDGLSIRAALTLVTLLALLTYPRTQHIRPQLWSLLAFVGLLALLKSVDRGQRTALAGIPLVLAAWANFHGGFVVAVLPLALWGVREILDRSQTIRAGATTIGVFVVASIATLINPYGLGLWSFLARTVGLERGDITEWLPVTAAGGAVFVFWAVTVALAVFAMWRPGFMTRQAGARGPGPTLHGQRARPQIERILLVAGLAVASFRVSRLDAFFAVATVMCFAPALASVLARERSGTFVRRTIPTAAAVSLLVVGAATFLLVRPGPSPLQCVDMVSAKWLPEREASEFVAKNGLHGRMVVYFDWGEYVLWHFAPRIKVSTDGRRETIYSDRHILGHLQLYGGTERGLEYFRELDAEYAWLPKSLPLVARLPSLGWHELYSGSRSAIFGRTPGAPQPVRATAAVTRCFPGP
jgi:hypothetical protein